MVWGRYAGRERSARGNLAESAAPLEQSLRAALVESRSRYKDLVELSSDFAFETDAGGRFAFVSPKGALGYGPDELVGRLASSLIFDVSGIPDESPVFTPRRPIVDHEVWVRTKSGSPALLLVTAAPLTTPDGSFFAARGIARDISQSYAQEQALVKADIRERDRKSTRLNSSHTDISRMPSSA